MHHVAIIIIEALQHTIGSYSCRIYVIRNPFIYRLWRRQPTIENIYTQDVNPGMTAHHIQYPNIPILYTEKSRKILSATKVFLKPI